MPQIALLTGNEDNLACLLVRARASTPASCPPRARAAVWTSTAASGAPRSPGCRDAGDCTGSSCPLWAAPASLAAYDLVLLGCEGAANLQTKPAGALQAMHDWLSSGGRLFGVHSQDVWLAAGPGDFPLLATWVDGGASGAPGPFRIDTTFPKGLNFRNWSEAVGASDGDGGVVLASGDVATSVAAVQPPARAWIHDESTAGPDGSAGYVKALSVEVATSIDAGEQPACGVAVLTDIHPGGTVALSPLPGACPTGPLGAEEKVLEFLLFSTPCASAHHERANALHPPLRRPTTKGSERTTRRHPAGEPLPARRGARGVRRTRFGRRVGERHTPYWHGQHEYVLPAGVTARNAQASGGS